MSRQISTGVFPENAYIFTDSCGSAVHSCFATLLHSSELVDRHTSFLCSRQEKLLRSSAMVTFHMLGDIGYFL